MAIVAGYDRLLVEAFLEALDTPRYRAWAKTPTLDNLREYADDLRTQESSQMRWDIRSGHPNAGAIRGRFGR